MSNLAPIVFVVAILICGCAKADDIGAEKEDKIVKLVMNMKLTSPAFGHNSKIPHEYTCDGDDISPELNIEDVPSNAKSLVLINDDPDAPVGTWDHWIVFNVKPDIKKINENEEPIGVAGKNSWGRTGYGGPCPPSGTHRYFFKIYALDTELNLQEGSTKQEIEKAMGGHIIEKAELIGLYERE